MPLILQLGERDREFGARVINVAAPARPSRRAPRGAACSARQAGDWLRFQRRGSLYLSSNRTSEGCPNLTGLNERRPPPRIVGIFFPSLELRQYDPAATAPSSVVVCATVLPDPHRSRR
jgi:hypothetical protein